MNLEFQVKKSNPTLSRLVKFEEKPLMAGQIRLKIDCFAFTANNLTYAAAGDMLGYWQFFPATDNEDQSWGVIPVWAFADVVESNNPAVPVGDRLYGYFPPATSLVIQADHITAQALIDNCAHRQSLPPLYNRYRRVLAEPTYDKKNDAATTLLAPLHITSFCLYDQLVDKDFYQAEQIIIVSASSKTSLGLAHGLAQDDKAPAIVGLTSKGNVDFVSGLEIYQQVIDYSSIAEELGQKSTVVIDMAGNAAVRKTLQEHLGDKLCHYIGVGLTHWTKLGDMKSFSSPKQPSSSENFFAPSYILQRLKDWGPGEFDKRSTEFVASAAKATFGWMTVDQRSGLAALSEVYPQMCEGKLPPSSGLVIKM